MILPVFLLSVAVWAWPSDVARQRLRVLHGRGARVLRGSKWLGASGAVGAVILGWFAIGPGVAIAGGLVGVTVWRQVRDRRRVRSRIAVTEGLAEALRSLVAELESGAHPADAAESAARDAHSEVAVTLRAAAAVVRLGGDLDTVFGRSGNTAAVGTAWRLAARHGLALGDVLDAVRADFDHQVRFARQVLARMAGPRASAAVLAGLPVLGVILGQAMGAAPLHVLTGSFAGQALLVVGVGLACAGVLWTARLTGRVIST